MPQSKKAKETTQARVGTTGDAQSSRTATADGEVPTGIFEFTETTYVDVMWFCAWENTDWMAVLSKPTADGVWSLVYRFRYYAPDETVDQIWESKDRKSVYSLKTDATEANRAKIEATTDAICETLTRANAPKSYSSKLIVRGSSEHAIELLSVQDWAHKKRIPVNSEATKS